MRRAPRESYEELMKRARTSYGYVYLLRCEQTSFIKIGWTLKSPEERAREVQAEFRAGFDFRLVAAFFYYSPPGVEVMFHELLDDYRVNDRREWFVVPPSRGQVLADIFALCSESGALGKEAAYAQGRRDAIEKLLRAAIAYLEEAVLDHASYVGYSYEEEHYDESFGGGVEESMWWARETRAARLPLPLARECVIEEIMHEAGVIQSDRKGIEYIPDDSWEYLGALAATLDAVGEDGQGLKYEVLRPRAREQPSSIVIDLSY
jgi:hypothetical protein